MRGDSLLILGSFGNYGGLLGTGIKGYGEGSDSSLIVSMSNPVASSSATIAI